jgi:hypothetical protein
MPRIITIPFAVRERKDSSKRSIAEEDIVRTVQKDGRVSEATLHVQKMLEETLKSLIKI